MIQFIMCGRLVRMNKCNIKIRRMRRLIIIEESIVMLIITQIQGLRTKKVIDKMRVVIESYPERCVNWKNLSWEEQRIIENTVLIVGVLYAMCKVQLVYKSNYSDQNLINHAVINKAEQDANDVMAQVAA